MRWILPYIAPFLCSLLWFCCKPFAAHGAKPPNVGLSSCLPALCCKGRVCTCPSPMQSEGSAGTRELEMLQSVLTWKNSDWNPQLKVFLSSHCAVGLYYFLCGASLQLALFLSLTFLLLYSTGKHLWLGRKQWETRSTSLHAVGSWKGETTWSGNLLACVLPPHTAITYSQGSSYCIWGTDLFHAMLLWGNHGLKWRRAKWPVPLGVLNKY